MELEMQALLVFLTTVVVDWMWGKYIIHTAEKRAVRSALYATVLTLTGAFVTISYINDHRMLVPAAFGAFVGTYLTVKMSRG